MSAEGSARRVRVRLGGGRGYTVEVGPGTLSMLGKVVRAALPEEARRVAVISNRRVFRLYGERVLRGVGEAGLAVSFWLMSDGERFKTLRSAERALGFLFESGIERSDGVLALGGGVVGDLAGFAAALHLRGVACLQVPTTLLAQIDSSVGGKTGVNTRWGKNLVGAFHQPVAVIADTATLRTLASREMTAGWCEAIKQGAVGDRQLFAKTLRFLTEAGSGADGAVVEHGAELSSLIAAHVEFKARVIAGDEREALSRTDALSRRILNFGHTVGHALEAATCYRHFLHDEAVGYGMLAAAEISKRLGLMAADELELLCEAVRFAGPLPRADQIDADQVIEAIGADKKSAGGSVRWVLLEGIGRARIVDGVEIPAHIIRASVCAALHRVFS